MPLYSAGRLLTQQRLAWSATVDQELTGSVDTVQAYSAAGAFDTIPALLLKTGDTVLYKAVWEITGDGAAGYFIPGIYWGGTATGVAMMDTNAIVVPALAVLVFAEVAVTIRTAGASPVWGWSSFFVTSTSTTYQNQKAAFGLTSFPTSVAIPVEASARFYSSPDASDKAKLRSFSRQILRAA